MFLLSSAEHDYIIKVNDAVSEVQLSQCVLHETLESHWGVAETKRHVGEFIEPQIPNSKCCILL